MNQSTHTPLTSLQLEGLHARIKTDRVAKRKQAGKELSYVEAYDVKATLIKIFGYAGFSAECLDAQIVREHHAPPEGERATPQWHMTAKAVVRLTIHQTGAVYTEYAIAGGKGADYTETADLALKSAESDALKRAAAYLGTQFGLSLYKGGSTDNIINAVLAPDQAEITTAIKVQRAETPEEKEAAAKLQAVLKVHSPTVTEVATTASEPTVTEVPVATVAAPVAKALENAERTRQALDAAEGLTPAQQEKRDKLQDMLNAVDEAEIEARLETPPQRQTAPKRARRTKPTVTADRQAVARQALADAEQRVYGDDSARARAIGTTPPVRHNDDPYLLNYGPGSPDFVMDDEIAAREDSGR